MTPLIAHYRTWSAGNFAINAVVTFASTVEPPKGPRTWRWPPPRSARKNGIRALDSPRKSVID